MENLRCSRREGRFKVGLLWPSISPSAICGDGASHFAHFTMILRQTKLLLPSRARKLLLETTTRPAGQQEGHLLPSQENALCVCVNCRHICNFSKPIHNNRHTNTHSFVHRSVVCQLESHPLMMMSTFVWTGWLVCNYQFCEWN